MNYTKLSIVSLGLAAAGSFVNAADEGFVLFGDDVAKPAAEEKAVRPISAPYYHEDSFVTTDLRAWYLNHQLGEINGSVDVAALQVRVALTESLQLVAYKDGYTNFKDTDIDGLVSDGWNDVGAGIKWAFIQDWENQFHMAVGAGYEFGWGDDEVLQDTEEYRLWLSANKGFDKLHLGVTVNYLIADDTEANVLGSSDMLTVHLHADYYLTEWLSPVIEVNGYFVQDEGKNSLDIPFSGVDAASIGGGEDNDTITGVLGFELRPLGDDLGLRAAYETQLNDDDSLFGYRWTFSAVYEF
ncbi:MULTISPECIES: hypothetical protein [unclassified Lentimonas]|uniref:hypothetical protein n=1 Tax=unclassified Lentimonas TaxID=2630993 RepID=UPI00138A51BD|nr:MULTISPECIES: hypothetical protein [unclassified Lentimonas]